MKASCLRTLRRCRLAGGFAVLVTCLLPAFTAALHGTPASQFHRSFNLNVGEPVDVAPWGERASWTDGKDAGILWEDPRDVFRVVVTFADVVPDPSAARLQWWHSVWPETHIPRDHPSGASESGWQELGDWYRGQWRDADADLKADGKTWTFTFRPVNAKEFPNLKDFAATYRTTLRLRLLFGGPAPKVDKLQAFTDSTWQNLRVNLDWKNQADGKASRFETFNGFALAPQGSASKFAQSVLLWFTESPNVNTFDSTVVTIRTPRHTFSFDPVALQRAGRIPVTFAGVTLSTVGVGAAPTANEPTIYARVFSEPDQSLARAMAEQPPHKQFYFPMGTEGGRQRFGMDPEGIAFCVNDRIDQPVGKDTRRRTWGGNRLDFAFGLPDAMPNKRWIEDGFLPIINAEWERDGIVYTQTAFVTRLEPGSLGFPDMKADDTAVLMVHIAGRNAAQQYREAHVVLSLKVDGRPVKITLTNDLVFAELDGGPLLRGVVSCQAEGKPVDDGKGIRFAANLPPGTDGAMVLRIPFVTLDQPAEIERLRNLDFEDEFYRVRKFWQARADASAQIHTPVAELNDFYRAHVSHLLINCGREVGADRLMARVGGFGYGVYGNESCMMIMDLDCRGMHREAERCLETFLRYQSTTPLPGDYDSQDGIFNGANGWEQGGYNQHHGWIMRTMAEHYRYSGDRAWLARNADKLVKAARWIVRERARTRNLTGLRAIERGLLPPGSLEDIGDWRCWLSNNVFSWWGLDAVAKALAEIGHPEAKALQAEADAYRRDILAAFHEASVRSPLVELRDGTWIQQIPSEVHRRGRTFGWITTTLEGSIYLIRTGLIAPNDPLALNILKDFEDNLYLSERYGYSWTKHGAQWFSRGGFSMQPNLLCSPQPYLMRDEPKHFLRAYFNGFAACYYPETKMMTEHPLPDLGDWRGDHYKTSDESNSNYWLRLMFIEDDQGDDVLRLGMAIPRAWLNDGEQPSIERAATFFGPMSLRFASKAKSGQITAVVEPPTRRTPKQVLLRFRHPEGKLIRRVDVNGKPWARFDVKKEWVDLTGLNGTTTVTAFYGN
ncbi:MAG: hypothetical protein ABSC03_14645 [Verrucomicrobiota bacterium]|jgi:hypothetical protein